LTNFAIDSLRESALQWAISSQSEKEGLSTTKNLTADDTDNTDLHGSEKGFEETGPKAIVKAA
jgi:hypothetical protein